MFHMAVEICGICFACLGACLRVRAICIGAVYLHVSVCSGTAISLYLCLRISPELWTKTVSSPDQNRRHFFQPNNLCVYARISVVPMHVYILCVSFLGAWACLCVCLCEQAVVHACWAVMPACLTGHVQFKIHIQHFALFSSPPPSFSPF